MMRQEISSVIARVCGNQLGKLQERLSKVAVNGDSRRFVINRMGSTGSTWLAKLLNSHPDVFCSHEGIVEHVFPSCSYTSDDIIRFIEYLAWDAKHGAYHAIGDVGSVWASHIPSLPFTTALLVRHPARLLQTRLEVYPRDQSFTEISPDSAACLREIWDLDLNAQEPLDRIFLHDLWTFVAQVWLLDKVGMVIRIEDMRNAGNCHRILKMLTGLEYPDGLVETCLGKQVNQRSGKAGRRISEIINGFSMKQREWYHLIMGGTLGYFGYDPWEDVRPGELPQLAYVLDSVG
jgi:hypothetical protein